MKESYELRMYGLVPYNISPIQQAIQFGHAVVEYANFNFNTPEYQDWARNWKTFIILNGGTSNDGIMGLDGEFLNTGTMQQHITALSENYITMALFREPDLNDMISAVVFLVDERVFNKKDYPDFRDYLKANFSNEIEIGNIKYSQHFDNISLKSEKILSEEYNKTYKKWVELVGGERNAFLKSFLSQFKKA